MSISRRNFLKAGTIAAVVAGISLRPGLSVFSQNLGAQAPQSDPLSYYTMATFEQYLNSVFIVRGFTTVEVTLTSVQDTLSANTSRAGGRESFLLMFRGGSARLPQETYVIEHPALGKFNLFLVPSGADENGAQGYVATINRLAYSTEPVQPRKKQSAKPRTSMPDTSKPQPPVQAPQKAAPAPAPAVKPTRKTKPESPEFDRNRLRL